MKTARNNLLNALDGANNPSTLVDAYRDEVAIEMGRDLLRIGLMPFLTRLVGADNARDFSCGEGCTGWGCSFCDRS